MRTFFTAIKDGPLGGVPDCCPICPTAPPMASSTAAGSMPVRSDETTESVGVEVDGADAGIGAVGFPLPDGGVSHR